MAASRPPRSDKPATPVAARRVSASAVASARPRPVPTARPATHIVDRRHFRIAHNQVGAWPKDRIVSEKEMLDMPGCDVERLIRVGAIVESHRALSEEPLPSGPYNHTGTDSGDESPPIVAAPAPGDVNPADPDAAAPGDDKPNRLLGDNPEDDEELEDDDADADDEDEPVDTGNTSAPPPPPAKP